MAGGAYTGLHGNSPPALWGLWGPCLSGGAWVGPSTTCCTGCAACTVLPELCVDLQSSCLNAFKGSEGRDGAKH